MDLTVTPQEGRWYRVSCVRAFYGSDQYLQWWPVIGPGHSDREILNFPPEHFHVDYRFLSNRKRRVLRDYWDLHRSEPSPSETGGRDGFHYSDLRSSDPPHCSAAKRRPLQVGREPVRTAQAVQYLRAV